MRKILQNFTIPLWAVIAIMAVGYVAGLFVEMVDNDSANHASISLAMLQNGSWTSLLDRGVPYLDKPHFQFWIVAASFYLFGITTVAYKISSFILTLLGLWATYKLTLHLLSRQEAIYATLITASMAAFALANVDVRMDAILTASIIIAVWQGVMFIDRHRIGYAVASALALAIAFGTKGWIGVAVPAIALCSFTVYRGCMLSFLKWRVWLVVGMFALFISPVLYAYYHQFDMHPDMIIRGTSGHSGIKFILWDQVFGRMGGEMGASGSANDHLFYLHTLLWASLPWSFLFYYLFFKDVIAVARRREKISAIFAITVPTIVMTIVAFSLSNFKLPHYINVIFPFMAILIANSLARIGGEGEIRKINVMQKTILFVVIIFVAIINLYLFEIPSRAWYIITALGCLASTMLLFYDNRSLKAMVYTGALFSGLLWITLNTNFYPQVNSYQGGGTMARLAKSKGIEPQSIGFYKSDDQSYSFDIYLGRVPEFWTWEQIESRAQTGKSTYLYLVERVYAELAEQGVKMEVIGSAPDYRITRLNAKFLNPKTRGELLSKVYLVKLL